MPKTCQTNQYSTRLERLVCSFNELEYHHFDDEQDIHMSSKIYEEFGFGLNLDLLTISY